MNRAEKIAKMVEKFGESFTILQNPEIAEGMSFQPLTGQLDIISQGDYWKVTFICHGAKSFFCDGIARCVFFRKDSGDCGDNHCASILEYIDSNKMIRNYTDEEKVLDVFNRIAAMIDLAYAEHFPE